MRAAALAALDLPLKARKAAATAKLLGQRRTKRPRRITPTGTITVFSPPTAGSLPFGIAPGADGNLWFTEFFNNKIGRITPTGTVTGEFLIPTANSVPEFIAAGADGNLWFTEGAPAPIGENPRPRNTRKDATGS